MTRAGLIALVAALGLLAPGCVDEGTDFAKLRAENTTRVTTDRTYFRDAHGRYVYFAGLNVGGDTKVPCRFTVDGKTHDCAEGPVDATAMPMSAQVSYVGRPFPLDQADHWFGLLARHGINTIRYLVLWDAIEHEGPGKFDTEYLDYVEALVEKAREHGLYVLLDMHSDLFTRYLHVNYSSEPEYGEPGSIEWMLLSLLPHKNGKVARDGTYDDRVGGDGAPRWVVERCLPEKNLDSPHWGKPYLIGHWDVGFVCTAYRLYQEFSNVPEDERLAAAECQVLEAKRDDACAYLLDPVAGLAKVEGTALKPTLDDVLAEVSKPELAWLGSVLRYVCEDPWETFDVTETSNFLPLNDWWNNALLSNDNERCLAAFFAGDRVWPDWRVDPQTGLTLPKPAEPEDGEEPAPPQGVSIREFLQDHYIQSWLQVVERVKDAPNVVGYDLMNEPAAAFVMLTVLAAYFNLGGLCEVDPDADLLSDTCLESAVVGLFQGDPAMGKRVYKLIAGLGLLPPDLSDESRRKYGLEGLDLMALLDLNFSFDWAFLQPFYQRLGSRLQDADPDAIIWIENTGGGAGGVAGLEGLFGESWMERLRYMAPGSEEWSDAYLKQQVYAPHWYPDIYPYFGLNEMPREFSVDEWKFEEFVDGIRETMNSQKGSLVNPPVVFGEFGTYFNYNLRRVQGITDLEIKNVLQTESYPVSAEILDNYYEAFESLFVGRIQWCLSAQNSYRWGDLWNREDFSVVDPEGRVRGELAWARPAPHALSGKPVAMHFWSDYHYYDPDKGQVNPNREFFLEMGSKESDAPTEIGVPDAQYPDGFYVWLSDGTASFDWERNVLYWYPTRDEPGRTHTIRILPPLAGQENKGWTYFFQNGRAVSGDVATW